MPRGNIIITTLNKLRPGGGTGFRGISIVDTSSSQRERPKGVTRTPVDKSQPDPESSSYPIALASSNVPPRYPSGILTRTNPETGKLPYYEADDDEILTRMFGVGTHYYSQERKEV